MTIIVLALVFFLLRVAVSVIFTNRARHQLTIEQKAAIFDASAKQTVWPLILMAVLMGAFGLESVHGHHSQWLFPVFALTVLAVVIASSVARSRRLSRVGAPPAYLRTLRIESWVLWIAAFLLFGSFWRIATRRTFTLQMIETVLVEAKLALAGGRSALSR